MRALLLQNPGELVLTNLETPHPSAGEALVQIYASAIQPSDILNSRGGFAQTVYPRIPGRDFSGIIVSVGEGLSPSLVGKAVFGSSGSTHAFTEEGFQAEYAIISGDEIVEKPDGLTHVQAATLGVPLSTAALTVERAGITEEEKILVLGANGAVGSAVCALLTNHHILRGVRGAGGDVDTKADLTLEAAGEVDVVIDTVGSPPLTEAAVDRLTPGGRVVFISSPKNEADPKLAVKMLDFYRKEKSLIGVNSIRKSAKDMAQLLRKIDGSILVNYAQSEARWTEIELEKAVAAYQDKTPGKKYVVKLI